MLSVLGSLVFLVAALAAVFAVGLTFADFWDRALANVAALREVGEMREFRFSVAGTVRRPPAPVQRVIARPARRPWFSSAPRLLAAA